MTGLPDDPSDRPTRMTPLGADASQQQVLESEPEAEGTEPDIAPQPWYRNRVLLALWALMVALLLTLIIYGMVELSRGGGSSIPTPHTSTPTHSSTTSPSPTTTTPSTTGPSTSPPSTTETPPPETPEEAPPPVNSPAPTQPPRHHHHFHLPHLF